MSRVFLAEETALGRKVVIKVLPPEMAAAVNQDRFRREMQVVARLQHPHVVPLLNAGLAGELLWYSMPFVEGESLRARLERGGELPLAEAARLLREVAEALDHAHSQGVVHRDIKPDNVLLSGGHAVVTDFGVAKAVSESGGGGALTSVGFALGTPAYMAPEQATADPHTDERADIYALGAMAYEMLTGQPPFSGSSPQAVLAAHITQVPTAVSSVRPAIPPVLATVVMRCLEKRPADRFQKARDLLPHLDAYLTPSGGTLATAAAPTVSSGTEAALRRTHPVRVAVLFALGALIALSATWWLVQRIGLPDWVFFAAIGLLLAGLPIVLRASLHERQRALARTTGTSLPVPSGPLGQLSTLRGAIRGGVLAFAGLVAGAGAFMGLRAAGIGPFATLVSAGVLSERDRFVLADFANRTSDSTLGASITEALRIDLSRSSVVRLLEAAEVGAALERMERNPDTTLTQALANEVAQRAGAKAVVAGEIAPLGGGYVLTANVLTAGSGSMLLAERETADNASGLIAAVDRLSRKLRAGIGESLRSIRAGEPLEEVTTSSLEALRIYTQSERAADRASYVESVRLLGDALRLDSTFAMAWRKLAVVKGNQRSDRAGEVAATIKAYELRDRLPERERMQATAYYYYTVENDRDKVIPAYRQLLQRFPDDVSALNNIALALTEKRRFAEAEAAARQGLAVAPQTGVLWANLVSALVGQGRYAAADSALEQWRQVAPNALNRQSMGYAVAFSQGDYATARAHADTLGAVDDPVWRENSRMQQSSLALVHGQLAEAERGYREVMDLRVARGDVDSYYWPLNQWLLGVVQVRAQPATMIHLLDSALALHPIETLPPYNRPYLLMAMLYAKAGATERAERLIHEWQQAVSEVEQHASDEAPGTLGMVALARGRYAEAIAGFRAQAAKSGCGVCWRYETGQAFEGLRLPDSALVAYEAVVTTPDTWAPDRLARLLPAYYRLGEMYESRGDKVKAVEYYGRFAELWKDADAELQPRVAEVRKRIAALAGEPK